MKALAAVGLTAASLLIDAATALYDWATNRDTRLDRDIAAIDADLKRMAEGD